MIFALAVLAVLVLLTSRRVRAIRDVPELMAILWDAREPDAKDKTLGARMRRDSPRELRCVWPRSRGEDRLWLDSNLSKERLWGASRAAEDMGLVERLACNALIGPGDILVGIKPALVGRYWADAPGEEEGWWADPEPVEWLSSFLNCDRILELKSASA